VSVRVHACIHIIRRSISIINLISGRIEVPLLEGTKTVYLWSNNREFKELTDMLSRHSSILTLTVFIGLVALSGGHAEKEIPMTKFSQNVGGPTMTFLYCYSCGYRKAFEEYVNILGDKYPQILIKGANYDPPGLNYYLSKLIVAAKMLAIIVIVSSFDIWGHIGQAIPNWYRWCTDNKIYACMMIFFVGNMLEAQLISSGAFEISINDIPVWSKLETGRIPSPQELFQIIDSHINVFSTATVQNFDQ